MKHFHCDCGQRVFFENHVCLACGRALGFDFPALTIKSLTDGPGGELQAADGSRYRRCRNQIEHLNCNWLVAVDDDQALCASCRLNEVIPALDRAGNLELWTRVERAKRRLLYSLGKLALPLAPAIGRSLRFRILEDRRRNPDVFESFVATAHHDGAITVNIAEADDAVRHAVREQMQERYRTVLGHLRHESGHFYFNTLVDTDARLAEFRELFGDERSDYASAVQRHYESGPPTDWPEHYVSAYASAHPAEDFAETFAHFLHIDDALETAQAAGIQKGSNDSGDGRGDWIGRWAELSVTLNEILRSLGVDDPYPFVLTQPVRRKLDFIDRLVCRPVSRPDG